MIPYRRENEVTPKIATSSIGLLAMSFFVTFAGCNVVLGGDYSVGPDASTPSPHPDGGKPDAIGPVDARADTTSVPEGGPDETGVPESGESGPGVADGGDSSCSTSPLTKAQFENACGGDAACAPFDNAARNTLCGANGTSCPRVEPPDAGAAADTGADSGASDSGASDTGEPEDASPADGSQGDAADAAVVVDAGPQLPSCFALNRGPAGGALPAPIVYATGSTAIQPYVARVAQVLESLSIASVVYLGAGSCFGINAMTDPAHYPLRAIGKTATYYDPVLDGKNNVQSGTCAIDDASRIADVGISDVFPTTCSPDLASQGGLPKNLYDFFGPVQVMELVVPAMSSQKTISAEAAYMVWGYGNTSGVAPWSDEGLLLQRSPTSGTQNMIGAAIGLSPGLWHGVKNSTSTSVLTALENIDAMRAIDGGTASDPMATEKTMGILASDVADSNRQVLHPLAFQDVGQSCGWYPDSTQDAFDKRNVRDGRYPIWGPSHLVVYTDGNGNPTNTAAKTLVDAMNGANSQVLATLDVVQFYAKSHIIPTCAMHVTRASDGHDYGPYKPPISCSCYYDSQTSQQTSCVACNTDADCKNAPGGATTCVNIFGLPPVGYCEPPG
jgi:hypothetical protein